MGVGRLSAAAPFVERFSLWSEDDRAAAARIAGLAAGGELDVLRVSFADQHGVLRGKSVTAPEVAGVLAGGCTITTTLLLKDTSHRTVFPVWQAGAGMGRDELAGACDFLIVPDPATFRMLPWLERTGWVLCDLYHPDGRAVPYSTRNVCRTALAALASAGYDYVSGLEVEFHVLKIEDPSLRPAQAGQPGVPPEVSLVTQGFQYLTETRLDQLEPVLDLVRGTCVALDLPLRSLEVEFGPSQCELTFAVRDGMAHADNMVLLRSAVKQVCRRHGYHATFMCRPNVPNLFSSGWHQHQSLRDRVQHHNAFTPEDGALLSPLGRRFAAGLLDHAAAACVFTTPTVNGYKRYQPFALAPERIGWGRDNRGAMLRAIGGPGDPATRIENRVGEPAANPYLYVASQIYAGLDGIERALEPPPPTDTPYADGEKLPGSLIESLAALRADEMFRTRLGDDFLDYVLTIKQAEVERFLSQVTDWEHREYFDLY